MYSVRDVQGSVILLPRFAIRLLSEHALSMVVLVVSAWLKR